MPAEEMPGQILAYIAHPFVSGEKHADLLQGPLDPALEQDLEVVPGLGGLVAGRVQPRLDGALRRPEYVADHLLGAGARLRQKLEPIRHGLLEGGGTLLLGPGDRSHAREPDLLHTLHDGRGSLGRRPPGSARA